MRNAYKVLRRDLTRIRRAPKSWAIIIGLLVLPSLYAWVNIIAFWAPYGNADHIKVAVVNQDEGASTELTGEVNVGEQVVAQLKSNDQLGWQFMDEDAAMESVRSGESYAAIVMPPDFSKNLLTIVTGDFVRAAIGLGCAGVFFAAQDAAPDKFSAAAYAELGRPYDLQVLAAAREAGGWFNVLHMHGDDVHFDLLSAYEVSALNWHIGETPTRIEDYRRAGGTRPIVGGLRRQDLTESRLDGIRRSIGQTVAETDGRGLILTPACVIRYPVVPDTLRHAARLIREWPIARALSPARAERPHALAL